MNDEKRWELITDDELEKLIVDSIKVFLEKARCRMTEEIAQEVYSTTCMTVGIRPSKIFTKNQ